ncbi:LysE/ArgO family amino acid transporter [Pelagibacterium sp. H642]|uniref:LysE/ArgO family amino acid transporter n=1 Tax=Pelagibacterium sp. H642 TaxID=1881069 RepID=UPI00281601AA|nr:LysE/ArgO family amino acid transporter [Pelagibacterium sp. H642]WMT91873.1 LysE/ArgO family amino acid transporter [Pelagibacterium sp. H642]
MTISVAPFISGFALSAALIMAIGAQNLFVLRQGLKGEHVGAIVLFFGLSDALLIAAGVSGVGAILSAIPKLATILTTGGALFLAWYGITALRRVTAVNALSVTATAGGLSLGRVMLTGAAFTFLNPHVYLDTVLLMGTAASTHPSVSRPVFALGAVTASFVWFATLGYGARLLQPVFTRPFAWRFLDAVVGIVMLGLSASLLIRAFNG